MTEPQTQIVKDRSRTHGDPVVNMQRVALAWSGVLGHQVDAEDVTRCMSALHLVRDAAASTDDTSHLEHADGYNDITRMVKANEPWMDMRDIQKAAAKLEHEEPQYAERVVPSLDRGRHPNKPWILCITDDGIVRDDRRVDHSPFTQNRRIIFLSVPKWVKLNAPTTGARDLLEVVAEAMDTEPCEVCGALKAGGCTCTEVDRT